jgi:hypothetical protein
LNCLGYRAYYFLTERTEFTEMGEGVYFQFQCFGACRTKLVKVSRANCQVSSPAFQRSQFFNT